MKRTVSLATAAVVAAGVVAATGPVAGTAANAAAVEVPSSKVRVKALSSDGKLLKFTLSRPDVVTKRDITGLDLDSRLIGIDYRPANKRLYGVGNLGGVYTINVSSGVSSRVGQLTVLPDGQQFDIDFNPVVDRLRIVSDTGQNLRHDVDGNVTTNDTALNSPPTEGATAGVSGAAYTNNDASTDTGTLLFDISSATDQLLTQTPANSGTLTAVGKLGVDARPEVGFDIFSLTTGTGAAKRTVANLGLVSLHVRSTYKVYEIDLTTGEVARVPGFARGTNIVDLAVTPRG